MARILTAERTKRAQRDLPLDGINAKAAKAVEWTCKQLTEDDRQWLRSLPYVREVENFTVVHATLDSPERWGYVLDKLAADASFAHQNSPNNYSANEERL